MALPRPLLQVALDTKDLNTALKTTRLVSDVVDVIEVGTILCLAEGLGAVTSIRTLYPNKLILADVRIAKRVPSSPKWCLMRRRIGFLCSVQHL